MSKKTKPIEEGSQDQGSQDVSLVRMFKVTGENLPRREILASDSTAAVARYREIYRIHRPDIDLTAQEIHDGSR